MGVGDVISEKRNTLSALRFEEQAKHASETNRKLRSVYRSVTSELISFVTQRQKTTSGSFSRVKLEKKLANVVNSARNVNEARLETDATLSTA
jgi:hypothetical protein